MDMHVHLDGELDPPASYSEEFFMNSADIALRSTVFARRTLDAGFTTFGIWALGTFKPALHCVMRSQKHCAGPSNFRGRQGNGDHGWSCGSNERGEGRFAWRSRTKRGVINGPDDAYKAVRQRYKDGSDVVKLTVTGGVLSLAKSGDNPQFTDEELKPWLKLRRTTTLWWQFTPMAHSV